MPSAIFSHAHRVTYAECTSGNHIYYGRYLELMEAARGEFFRHLGKPFLVLKRKRKKSKRHLAVSDCAVTASYFRDILALPAVPQSYLRALK